MLKGYEKKLEKKEPEKIKVKRKKEKVSSIKDLKDKYKGKADISIRESGDIITLDKIIAKEKGKGVGTKFMKDLISHADASGKTIALTPSEDFGGTKKRLQKFYKRFGFEDNKGKKKDYEISESMYRIPQGLGNEKIMNKNGISYRLNTDFKEEEHPRDKGGQFAKDDEETTPKIKQIKREDLPEDVIYHTSPEKIEKIEDRGGNFQDSLFFSANEYSMSVGKTITYALDVENMDFIDPSQFFYHEDYEKLDGIVKDVMDYAEVNEETAQGLLDESENPFELIEDGEEASDLSWYLQGKQGEAAKKLGYDGADAEDEQGTVYIIPMIGRETDLIEVIEENENSIKNTLKRVFKLKN